MVRVASCAPSVQPNTESGCNGQSPSPGLREHLREEQRIAKQNIWEAHGFVTGGTKRRLDFYLSRFGPVALTA